MGVPVENMEASPFLLFSGRRAIEGVNTGSAIDAADTLAFSLLANVRPINEVFSVQAGARGLPADVARRSLPRRSRHDQTTGGM